MLAWVQYSSNVQYSSLKVPPPQNDNLSKFVVWGTDYDFFYFVEKLCSVFKIFKFLYFNRYHDLPNLWRHDGN